MKLYVGGSIDVTAHLMSAKEAHIVPKRLGYGRFDSYCGEHYDRHNWRSRGKAQRGYGRSRSFDAQRKYRSRSFMHPLAIPLVLNFRCCDTRSRKLRRTSLRRTKNHQRWDCFLLPAYAEVSLFRHRRYSYWLHSWTTP